MSIAQLLRILIARRMIILVTLLTSVGVALFVAKQLPERYSASARVLIDNFKPDPVTGQLISNVGARTYFRTQVELIKDYRVAGDVVDKLGWAESPAVIAAWRAETGGVGDFRRWGAARIISATNVQVVQGSNILELTYEAPNPAVAKTIAGLLRDAYITGSVRFRTDSAGRTADWYREQSERALQALIKAEQAKSKFEQDNQLVVLAGGGEAESTKLAGLQAALMSARGGEVAQSSQQMLPPSSGIVDQLKLQLASLNDQIGIAGERLGTEHPTYKTLIQRRAQLSSQLARESASARATTAAQTGASRQTVAQLEADYNAQRTKVLGMKNTLDQLGQLQREVDLRRSQYEKASARTADLRLESNVSESGLVVLGDVIGSTKPSFPNWPQITGLSVAFGLGLGMVLAVFVELLARRIRGTEDLAFSSKAPVLAVIADVAPSPWRDRLNKLLSRRRPNSDGLQPAQ